MLTTEQIVSKERQFLLSKMICGHPRACLVDADCPHCAAAAPGPCSKHGMQCKACIREEEVLEELISEQKTSTLLAMALIQLSKKTNNKFSLSWCESNQKDKLLEVINRTQTMLVDECCN